jgi:hypothetical protein
LILHEVPSRPWQKVGADIFSLYGKDYLLVVDYYSKYPEVNLLSGKTAPSVIVHIKSIFSRHGIPEEIVADNMLFNSLEMRRFAGEWNCHIVTSSRHSAQSNGQAERCLQTVKLLLKWRRKVELIHTSRYFSIVLHLFPVSVTALLSFSSVVHFAQSCLL